MPNDFPRAEILSFFSKEENWPSKPSDDMYATNKLLVQYCVNEIAKLAGTDEMYVSPLAPVGMIRKI